MPRVDELDVALDLDARAAHFKQASYAVPVRMALLSLLLGLDGKFKRFESGFRPVGERLYDRPADVGIRCANPKCIVHDEHERKFTRNKFHVMPFEPPRLRCFYCETDIALFVTARGRGGIVYFATDRDARAAGYEPTQAPARRKAG